MAARFLGSIAPASRGLRSLAAAALLVAGFGCSARTFVRHDEPQVVSEGAERLVVEVKAAPDGCLRVCAFRERDRVFEQHYWRSRESALESARAALAEPGMGARLGSNGPGVDTSGATIWAIGAIAVIVFFVAVAIPVYYFAIVAQGAATFLSVSVDDERTTIQHIETTRHPSAWVTVEPAAGGERIDLGSQPEDGWILTPELLRRMGGRGAEVRVRDGDLTATILIP